MVNVGDAVPNVELMEDNPSKKVNIGQELASGKGLVVGIPGAFSIASLPLPTPALHSSFVIKSMHMF